jgi:hypothetical protein
MPTKNMKLRTAISLSICAVLVFGYFAASKWAIRHKTFTFYDPMRNNRPIAVDVAVRPDKELRAIAGLIQLPVAVVSHGNTVPHQGRIETDLVYAVQNIGRGPWHLFAE